MSPTPIVVVVERANRYSVNVLLGYLVSRLGEAGLADRFRFVLVDWGRAADAIASLGRPHIMMASLLTTQIPYLVDKIRYSIEVSRRTGGIPVAGGPHATGDPYGTILNLGFDVAFVGEAEECFADFVEALASGGDPLSVCGAATLSEGGVAVRFGGRRVESLDAVPPFCEELRLFNPIEIMRGCPYACRYCQVSYMFGALPRFRSVENVVRHAKKLLRRGIRDIRFISPNGFQYMCHRGLDLGALSRLLESLHREVRAFGGRIYLGTFPSEVRPECVDEEVLRAIAGYVNNRRLNVGAQTGSDRLLKLLHRGHSADDVLNAVMSAVKHGFGIDVDYMFGLPWEEDEDLELTMMQIEKVVEAGGRIHCHAFIPLPGTPLSFAYPRSIPRPVRARLTKLMGRGRLWGQWLRQERLAREIVRLRDDNFILISYQRASNVASGMSKVVEGRYRVLSDNLRRVSKSLLDSCS